MDLLLERSHQLKQALTEFVLNAEGELAQALEVYAATQARRGRGDNVQQDLIIDTFITEAEVKDKTVLELFLEHQPNLTPSDCQLVSTWQRSFIGLFAVDKTLPDGFELWNWLTAKQYVVKPNNEQLRVSMNRFKTGEILLTRISPITEYYWTFSGPCTPMGKLGKPKLAVAIGNFKENHKSALYSDAPELLEQAWKSVEQYHQQFVDFFGSDEITLTGYQLNKKIAEFQELITQQKLIAAGIDANKTLTEVAQAAGVEEDEIRAAAAAGADSKVVSQLLENKNASKMIMPKVDLPAEIKKAEQVTALSHPRWGQMFLPTYSKLKTILATLDWQNIGDSEQLIRYYLENSTINSFVWQRLSQQYPTQLEAVLKTILKRPDFKLNRDLNTLLQEFGKLTEPELPEIASVPIHLHNLFQEAVAEVDKPKSKSKSKNKTGFGFQKS